MSEAPENPQAHDHDHAGTGPGGLLPECGCPACNPRPLTAEDEAAIAADPAARSLEKAVATSFGLLKLVMLALLGMLVLESFQFVEQGKVGLVRRFGAYLRDDRGEVRLFKPGTLFFLWPAPLEVLEKIPAGQELELTLDQEFWPTVTKQQEADPNAPELPPVPRLEPGKDGYGLSGDLNLAHSRWVIKYQVSDPERYKLTAENPETLLRATATAVIFKCLAGYAVDDALVHRSQELFALIDKSVRAAVLDEQGRPQWGLEVTRVINVKLLPPGNTQRAFNAVTQAGSERKEKVDKAHAEAARILAEAEAQANTVRNDSRAYALRLTRRAGADAQAMQDLLAKYPNDPVGLNVYLEQYRQDVLTEVLAGTKRYILRPGQTWFMTSPTPAEYLDAEETPAK